jgi:uncharacterized membrane protein
MNETRRRKKTSDQRTIAILIAVGGAAMIALAFLTPQVSGGGQMGRTNITYDVTNMILALAGGIVLTAALAFIFLRESYEPLDEEFVEAGPAAVPAPAPVAPVAPVAAPTVASAEAPPMPEPAPTSTDEKHLALRLLSGDERAIFRAIMDAGGETMQKDVVNRTKMSDAKVSRVLDRLEEKGLVARERHGMSNKVRIEIEP